MRGPEIPASVSTHLGAGFRLANKHEHLDDLSLNPAATNAPVQRGVKIHDILLDKSRVTVGQVAIDGLGFETPAPPRSWIYHLKFTT